MTLALIGSGLSLTLSYIILLRDESVKECLIILLYAISHGCLFIFFQVFEFFKRPVNFTDSVFGCSFYASTGLHALHVLVGLIFLATIALFVYTRTYTSTRHLSYDLGI
jgi:heme/copper-type cytochrome/quinol oxidase subunit 3